MEEKARAFRTVFGRRPKSLAQSFQEFFTDLKKVCEFVSVVEYQLNNIFF